MEATRANAKVPPLAHTAGRWFDIRRWAILGLGHRHPAPFLPVVRAEAAPFAFAPAASAHSGMVAGLLAVAGLIRLSHWHSLRGVLVAASGAPLLRRLLVLHSHRRLGYSMGQPSASRVIGLMAASGGAVSLHLLKAGAPARSRAWPQTAVPPPQELPLWWSEWGASPLGQASHSPTILGYSRIATGRPHHLPVVRAEATHAIRPGGLRSLSHRHLASPTWADGQSGRTNFRGRLGVRPLALITLMMPTLRLAGGSR